MRIPLIWGRHKVKSFVQWDPAVKHRDLYSILCDNLYGKRIWKRMDMCLCTTDSLCVHLKPAQHFKSTILQSFFFCFLGLYPWHMEIPRLGVELELQLPAYTTATAMPDLSCICELHHSSQQCQILNPLSEARDQTHNLMVPSWICFCCATMEMPNKISCINKRTPHKIKYTWPKK